MPHNGVVKSTVLSKNRNKTMTLPTHLAAKTKKFE